MAGKACGGQSAVARHAAAAAVLMLVIAGPGTPGRAWAQCGTPTVTVHIQPGIEVFRVSDFDPSDASFHPSIFDVSVCAPNPVVLELVITQDLGGDVLARGKTSPAVSVTKTTHLTNRDLTTNGGPYELDDFAITAAGTEVEGVILDTGILPEGSYCFTINLYDSTGTGAMLASGHDCLIVSNPTSIELLRPGERFGSDAPIVLTAHPQFQWTSRAMGFRFELAMAEPGDASGEDVMEHAPVYTTEENPWPGAVSGTGAPGGMVSFSYPSSAEDLRRGRTYCWQVTALVRSSSGSSDIPSQIYCFHRWDAADLSSIPIAEALAEILPQLIAELGPSVEGMTPTGEILLDGVAIDPATAAEILEGIQSGRLEVLGMEIQ